MRDQHKGIIPVINVIDPMVEEVIADDTIKKVGIIGTKATVASGTYQEKFSRRKPSLNYSAVATPLLANMIEEGFYNNHISKSILEKYLSLPELENIDALVLACTHYPLIKKEISEYFDGKVKILDSAEVVAEKLKWILEKEKLACEKKSDTDIFYVSDYTESFEKSTQIFFQQKVNLQKMNLWQQ